MPAIKRILFLVAACLLLVLFANSGAVAFAAPPTPPPAAFDSTLPVLPAGQVHACDGPLAPGQNRCFAIINLIPGTNRYSVDRPSTSPVPLGPNTMKAIYQFPTALAAGAGQTIAIVVAYDAPTIESDLNVFSKNFGLPACTTANGCFKKVNQNGGTSYPPVDSTGGWEIEASLDVEWAHAMAPGAKILLVEASNTYDANLYAAEQYAIAHARYVSNSWGRSEFPGEVNYDVYFKPGVSVFAALGNNGPPTTYPGSSPYVIGVGGTTLNFSSNGAFTGETGWSLTKQGNAGAGGCSQYEPAPSAQAAFPDYPRLGCNGKRATPDVSYDANPASGVWIYDTTRNNRGLRGWWLVGGTSLATPMWAARTAITQQTISPNDIYGRFLPFRDITVGNTGYPCLVGFDLCTGRGSWVGAPH